ncbi:MarR family winged helix-turn-helix transcriptional regulator [Desulfofundulus sp.]|uniref:MarR family winged helix-turn-helix transcriptional regulator n=1 Tax=Desulfofundulus sp. TaxID=2282750 RepID=UPI003C781757
MFLPTGATEKLEYLLRQINLLLNHYTRTYLNERGLTIARFWVLSNLSLEQPLTMGELQRRLLLAPGTITGLVDRLVEEGLVQRWRDEVDRRLVFLKLTPAGKKFLAEILQLRYSILEKALPDDNTDIKRLNRDLYTIFKNVRKLMGISGRGEE